MLVIKMAVDVSDSIAESSKINVKKKKPGIIYLSTLPPYMNVTKSKDIFSCYGDVGRIFLQPATGETKKNKPAVHFSEGWIEFQSKRIAKEVAARLNNMQIGGKKRSKFYDYTWNIKYLPRFKWAHLGERLAYEKAVRRQRLRTEIAQAKREANHYSSTLERKRKNLREVSSTRNYVGISSPKTDSDQPENRTDFLKSLFA